MRKALRFACQFQYSIATVGLLVTHHYTGSICLGVVAQFCGLVAVDVIRNYVK